MNREIFFATVRREPFSGRMTQSQVSGTEALLDACAKLTDVRWTAYVCATVFHETGARMVPVREGFATSDAAARRILKNREYAKPDPETGHAYYGRGLEQLTYRVNYERVGKLLGLDLVNNPDMMLQPDVAIRSLLLGMTNGLYTGKKLADYFTGSKADPVGARRIVNGTDRAGLIAGYYHAFLAAITAANAEEPVVNESLTTAERETPAPWYPDPKPLKQSNTIKAQTVAGVGTAGSAATEMVGDTLTQAQDAAGQLATYLDIAKWLFVALIVAGIAWTVYCRVKDSREGKR